MKNRKSWTHNIKIIKSLIRKENNIKRELNKSQNIIEVKKLEKNLRILYFH